MKMNVRGGPANSIAVTCTVGVKLKFPFTGCLRIVHSLNSNSFSCVLSVHTTDKLNMCRAISTS